MKFLEEIKDGDSVVGHYLCTEKQTYKTKAGKAYFSLTLADKTCRLNGKVWEINDDIQDFEQGDYIKIDALALLYKNEMQLRIKRIRKSMEGEYFVEDYIRTSEKDTAELYEQLVGYIGTIENQYVKKLLSNIFFDEKTAALFKQGSAAKNLHHSYVGGLAEHTVSVVGLCDFVQKRYKFINRDVLIAVAMLHDLAKIYEIAPMPQNDYTDCGQLLGHIVMGAEIVEREAAAIEGFPDGLRLLIKHCILAHHGELEFGSPKLPQIIEAFVLHLCDNMDAKIKAFEEGLEDDRGGNLWAGYSRMLGRNIRHTENSLT